MRRQHTDFLQSCIGAALVLAAYVLIRVNLIDIPLNRDEGGFAYLGKLIASGGKLYVDGCDLKPPGIFFVYSLLSLMAPLTAEGLHWALAIYNFGTLVLLACIASLMGGRFFAFWTALIYAVISASPAVYGFSGSAEMYMLLPITAAFLCAVLGVLINHAALFLLSGVFSGIAFWIKPSSIAISIFLAFYILLRPGRNTLYEPSVSFSSIISGVKIHAGPLWFISGSCAISAAVCAYFVWMGTWNEFIYWSFQHPYEYSAEVFQLDFILKRLGVQSYILISSWAGLWAVSILYAVLPLNGAHSQKPTIISFWLFSLAAAVHSPRAYSHYFALLCPATALLGASGICAFLRFTEKKALIYRILVGLLVGASAVLQPLWKEEDYYRHASSESTMKRIFPGNPFAESGIVAEYIRGKTSPDQKILIIGSEPQILVLADRASAVRFIYFYPLMGLFAKSRELQAQFFHDVGNNRPEYVLAVRSSSSLTTSPVYHKDFMERVMQILKVEFRLEAAAKMDPFPRVIELRGDASSRPIADSASILIYRRRAEQ